VSPDVANWINGTLVGFDLETTGVDVETCRIVSACIVVIKPLTDAGPIRGVEVRNWLVDPGVPIPAGASEIHGITDERVQAEGMDPKAAVYEIERELERWTFESGAPVVAFNAAYDLTVLDREVRRHWGADRHGYRPDHVIDPYVIDKAMDKYRKGKRTLTAACEHYKVEQGKAHDAEGDVMSTLRVAWMQAKRYPTLGETPLPDLHEAQVGWYAEQSASFAEYLRKQADKLGGGAQPDGQTAADLRARADSIQGSWPVKPVPA
jgi:DNA polymerase III subunit epsilon